MSLLIRLLAIAGVWCLLMGRLSSGQFLLGLFVALLTLAISQPIAGDGFRLRPLRLLAFLLVLSVDLCRSSLRVAIDALWPGQLSQPRILAVRVPAMDPVPLCVLANSITLTPGSLTLDVAADGRTIYVHDMYAPDHAAACATVAGSLAASVRAAIPDRQEPV